MENYDRVLPRDFFNESKLLKCLGQFALCIHKGKTNGIEFHVEFDGQRFDIVLSDGGELSCTNYRVFYQEEEIYLCINYNSRENYPLIAIYQDEIYEAFDDDGNFILDF